MQDSTIIDPDFLDAEYWGTAHLGEQLDKPTQLEMCDFVRCLERNYPETRLLSLFKLSDDTEAVAFDFTTGVSQQPAYEILPQEILVVAFRKDGFPIVGPFRTDFPFTPHADFHTSDVLKIDRALCLDDRPWADAQADYNASELLRRIAKWFKRADSGEMDDPFQWREPAFRPAPTSIVMPTCSQTERDPSLPCEIEYIAVTGEGEPKTAFWSNEAPDLPEGQSWTRFLLLPLFSNTKGHDGWWPIPYTLGQLDAAFDGGVHNHIKTMLGKIEKSLTQEAKQEFFQSNLIFVWTNKDTDRGDQKIALIPIDETIGELMEKLGLVGSEINSGSYAHLIIAQEPDIQALENISLAQANLMYPFETWMAQLMADRPLLTENILVVGAGAIGSQVTELLLREGAWNEVVIVDKDVLKPHNLARHNLTSRDFGQNKAKAVARRLSKILPSTKITALDEFMSTTPSTKLRKALDKAGVILDLSASIGTSRSLSDDPSKTRRVCAFFNPAGDSAVLMVEDKDRCIDLSLIEAHYYGEILRKAELENHLKSPAKQLFAGGCRDVTSRISASRAALLSASVSETIRVMLGDPDAGLRILTANDGGLSLINCEVSKTSYKASKEGWTVRLLNTVVDEMMIARSERLPNETGGSLLGVIDYKRKCIEVAAILPPPPDSSSSPIFFERGIENLTESLNLAGERTGFQLSYIGEWHSHPNSSAHPSTIDLKTLEKLSQEAKIEDRPAVMVIVAEKDTRLLVEC